jgi:hypothetical protein
MTEHYTLSGVVNDEDTREARNGMTVKRRSRGYEGTSRTTKVQEGTIRRRETRETREDDDDGQGDNNPRRGDNQGERK